MTGNAGGIIFGIAQHGVRTGAELGGYVVMAGDALGGGRLRRVAFLRRSRVAIDTAEILVNAMRKCRGIYGDGFALRIHHAGAGGVAGEAGFRGEEGGRHCG